MVRTCGNCTVCCYVPAVPALGKPVNHWCDHCIIHSGCKIYEQRPQQCRDFNCLWLTSSWMDDDLRPDRCGVMFEPIKGKRTVVASVDPDRCNIAANPDVMKVIDTLMVTQHPVVLVSEGHDEPLTLLPDGWGYEEAWRGNR